MSVGCAGGCGATTADVAASGWELLQITEGRYRCGACGRALRAASVQEGREATDADRVDPLPKDDRGALLKLREPPPLREHVR